MLLIPALLVSFSIFILLLVIYLIVKKSGGARDTVLICGLSDAGKTLLFSQLCYEQGVDTHSSLKENVERFTLNNKVATMVDVPGHERLRFQILENYKNRAKAMIFLIDSSTFTSQLRDVAEFLYIVLSDEVLSRISFPVLIACNKQDEVMTKSKKVIQSQLEKEFNSLRVTKAGSLESISGDEKQNYILGTEGIDFNFNQLKKNEIQFAECSAKDHELNEVKDWLSRSL